MKYSWNNLISHPIYAHTYKSYNPPLYIPNDVFVVFAVIMTVVVLRYLSFLDAVFVADVNIGRMQNFKIHTDTHIEP